MFIRASLIVVLLLSFSGLQAEITDKELSGLKLVSDSNKTQVYVKPGIDMNKYNVLALGSLNVSLDEKWLRRFNRERKSLSERLDSSDIKELTDRYAKSCEQTLKKTLAEESKFKMKKGAYTHVLRVNSAIIDLKISAPDIQTATRKSMNVSRAGQATLETRMYDGETGKLVAVIIDKKKTREYSRPFATSRSRNMFEFTEVYRDWAKTWLDSLELKG